MIVYDRDVTVVGEVTDIFRCAAQNVFLTSSGPLAPLNLGFLAFKPDLRLLRAAEFFVAESDYYMPTSSAIKGLPNGGYDGNPFVLIAERLSLLSHVQSQNCLCVAWCAIFAITPEEHPC